MSAEFAGVRLPESFAAISCRIPSMCLTDILRRNKCLDGEVNYLHGCYIDSAKCFSIDVVTFRYTFTAFSIVCFPTKASDARVNADVELDAKSVADGLEDVALVRSVPRGWSCRRLCATFTD
jgi:hypothetical protein